MVIVGGAFTMEPGQRQQFLASRLEMTRVSRGEPGCLEYTFAPDPIDPGRVVLYERWESQQALDAHLAALRAGTMPDDSAIGPIQSTVTIYDVSGEHRLGR